MPHHDDEDDGGDWVRAKGSAAGTCCVCDQLDPRSTLRERLGLAPFLHCAIFLFVWHDQHDLVAAVVVVVAVPVSRSLRSLCGFISRHKRYVYCCKSYEGVQLNAVPGSRGLCWQLHLHQRTVALGWPSWPRDHDLFARLALLRDCVAVYLGLNTPRVAAAVEAATATIPVAITAPVAAGASLSGTVPRRCRIALCICLNEL